MVGYKKQEQKSAAPGSLADLRATEPAPKAKGAGPFDWLAGLFRGKMNTQLAFYTVIACAMMADDREAPEELEELTALCHRTKTLNRLDRGGIARLHGRIEKRLGKDKRADLAKQAARSLPRAMRMSAFGHACDIVFADRVILRSEREFLKGLITTLSLDDREAEEMLRAISAKNAH